MKFPLIPAKSCLGYNENTAYSSHSNNKSHLIQIWIQCAAQVFGMSPIVIVHNSVLVCMLEWHCVAVHNTIGCILHFIYKYVYMNGSGKKLIQNDKIMKMAQITYSHSATHTHTNREKNTNEIKFSERKRWTYCAKSSTRIQPNVDHLQTDK